MAEVGKSLAYVTRAVTREGVTAGPSSNLTMPNAVSVSLTVNGACHHLTLDPRTTLLDLLREQLDLTGTKKGVTRVSAAPARCSSTAGASIPA